MLRAIRGGSLVPIVPSYNWDCTEPRRLIRTNQQSTASVPVTTTYRAVFTLTPKHLYPSTLSTVTKIQTRIKCRAIPSTPASQSRLCITKRVRKVSSPQLPFHRLFRHQAFRPLHLQAAHDFPRSPYVVRIAQTCYSVAKHCPVMTPASSM